MCLPFYRSNAHTECTVCVCATLQVRSEQLTRETEKRREEKRQWNTRQICICILWFLHRVQTIHLLLKFIAQIVRSFIIINVAWIAWPIKCIRAPFHSVPFYNAFQHDSRYVCIIHIYSSSHSRSRWPTMRGSYAIVCFLAGGHKQEVYAQPKCLCQCNGALLRIHSFTFWMCILILNSFFFQH